MDLLGEIDGWHVDKDQDVEYTPRSQSITEEKDRMNESPDANDTTSEDRIANDEEKIQQCKSKNQTVAARRNPAKDLEPKKS